MKYYFLIKKLLKKLIFKFIIIKKLSNYIKNISRQNLSYKPIINNSFFGHVSISKEYSNIIK